MLVTTQDNKLASESGNWGGLGKSKALKPYPPAKCLFRLGNNLRKTKMFEIRSELAKLFPGVCIHRLTPCV